jgi:GT2 family glycosyltransferase
MYYEDMQWCKDIKKLGYEIHFCADTEVVHLLGGSSGPKNEMMKANYDTFLRNNYSSLQRRMIKGLTRLLS